jgi:hypothetical protein
LNGIFTLISQGIPASVNNPKGRVGAPAPQLYVAFKKLGYCTGSPFKAISAGHNGFYSSTSTYNQATGLGPSTSTCWPRRSGPRPRSPRSNPPARRTAARRTDRPRTPEPFAHPA